MKDRLYESSVTATVQEETKYYERGEEVQEPVLGTVTLNVDGQPRHFSLGREITWTIESSIEVEENGKTKRFRYHQLANAAPFGEDCREIQRNGQTIRVKLDYELSEEYSRFIECTVEGVKRTVHWAGR